MPKRGHESGMTSYAQGAAEPEGRWGKALGLFTRRLLRGRRLGARRTTGESWGALSEEGASTRAKSV
jgi:hypothetical protein